MPKLATPSDYNILVMPVSDNVGAATVIVVHRWIRPHWVMPDARYFKVYDSPDREKYL